VIARERERERERGDDIDWRKSGYKEEGVCCKPKDDRVSEGSVDASNELHWTKRQSLMRPNCGRRFRMAHETRTGETTEAADSLFGGFVAGEVEQRERKDRRERERKEMGPYFEGVETSI
jgi:hypothetical protein